MSSVSRAFPIGSGRRRHIIRAHIHSPAVADLLELAVSAAHAAGALLCDRAADAASGVSTKSSPTDMVSDADRAAEDLVRAMIGGARPKDAVLGEEAGDAAGASGLRWVVDPLDGTTNYLYRYPVWSVSIACEDTAGWLVGVVHDPLRAETFAAARGAGATLNGVPVRVSEQSRLDRALIGTGFDYAAATRRAQALLVADLIGDIRDIRRNGSAALNLAWVAAGRLDGFFEAPLRRWDVAAGTLLVREAGGVVSSLTAAIGEGSGVLAAGPALHRGLQRRVAAAARRAGMR